MPRVSVSFLLLFIDGWNEFLFAFTLTIAPARVCSPSAFFEVPVRADVNTIPYDLIATGGVLILLRSFLAPACAETAVGRQSFRCRKGIDNGVHDAVKSPANCELRV
jgi:hypothetical protein